MPVKEWDVKEQFRFPESFGIPKEIKTVKVTPQFEQSETEDSIQLSGIYHITCHVEFEEGEHAHHATSEFTQIEDLDVQGEVGYFEYAVPMSVEIAKEKIQSGSSPTLSVQHVNSNATNQGTIEIGWLARCEFEAKAKVEPEAKTEPKSVTELVTEAKVEAPNETIVEPEEKNVVAVVESTNFIEPELQFLFNLDDGMSKQTYPSNYVFVKQETER